MNCPVCGTKVEDGTKFCTFCGARLQAAEPAQTTAPEPELVLEGKLETPGEWEPVPELVLEPTMEQAVEAAAMEAKEALDSAMIDPFKGASPVAPDPVYKKAPEVTPVKPVSAAAAQAMGGQAVAYAPGAQQQTAGAQQSYAGQQQRGAQQSYAGGPSYTGGQTYVGGQTYAGMPNMQAYAGVPVQKPVEPGHGTAIASLICGIASLIMSFASFGFLGVPLGVAGIITACISKNSGNREGIRTGGFVTSIIGLLLSILFIVGCVALIALGESV